MVASLVVVTGPAQSGKTHYLLSRYRAVLKTNKPGSVLWLSPTWRAAANARNQLLGNELDACWTPGVFTFAKFAGTVLEFSSAPIRPLTPSMKRQLVRQLIDELLFHGRLRHFRPIASTSGLVDLVCEFVSELKRLEIWPDDFRRACQARGFADKDRELLELYDTYQLTLRENQLYDAEGQFWSARDYLRQGQQKPFENLRLAVADGFTDFTRTQHEILDQLAGWVDEIIISLPLEPDPRRNDLLTKPLKTLNELQRRHRNLSVMELPRHENPHWPAMRHLEKNLFINPRRVQGAKTTEGVEILAAAKPQGEMELIGEKIKRLLVDGTAKPGDIAVVFRSPQDTGGLVAEVFDRLGIPIALEMGQTLDRVPAMRALKALVQLDLDDWPFRQLLAVLGSNYFQPDWPEWQAGKAATVLEQFIRNKQIPHGCAALLNQPVADKEKPVLAVLKRLAAGFDELPVKATLPQWAKAWEKLAQETGLLRAIDQNNQPITYNLKPITYNDRDIIAWNRLINTLSADDLLARWRNRRPPELDRNQAVGALLDVMGSQRMPVADDESGRVRVLSAASIRSLEIPYLFLAGLSEKAFPPPDREDRLYSEAEYLQLIEKGLPLVARTERAREEMLLFYEALTRATRRLYLSYPALDDAAQPLSPSPFLLEVMQACGIKRPPDPTDISPIPQVDDPLSAAQFRVKAMSDALSPSCNVSLLADLLQSGVPNLSAGLDLIMLRQDREAFSPAEGMMLGKAVQKQLAGTFSSQRCFTASELESYAACPYRFLLENVLELEPLEDITLQLDALERGQIVHEVLALFHRRVNESLGRPGSPLELDPQEFDRLMQKSLDDSLPKPSDNPVRAALAEINRRLITQWLADYREQCENYDKLWKECDSPLFPEFFEASFGKSKHQQGTLSVDVPLDFPDDKDMIHLSGRIDRIDTGKMAGKNIFNILDYKTGGSHKFSAEEVRRGTTLQLPLYALAAAELLLNDRDAYPWQAGYWHVKRNGFKPKQSLVMFKLANDGITITDEWEKCREDLTEIIPILVKNIRSGIFPIFNPDQRCTSYCPFGTICRIRQIRSLEKTWQPTP